MQNPERHSLGTAGYFLSIFGMPSRTSSLAFSSIPVLGVISIWCGWRLRLRVCILIRASPARMQTREREGSFCAETIWQQAFFVKIYVRIRTANLTANQKKKTGIKVSLQTQHVQTVSPHIKHVKYLWHICSFFVLICSQKVAIVQPNHKDGATSLTCNESRSEVL